MSKRVYKFTSADHGISNLENRRVKLSTIDELNDPFDLCSVDTTDPLLRSLVDANVQNFRGKLGILCFSRNWDNLLMWSHYGDKHAGLCMGFDIPDGPPGDGYDLDVNYQPNVIQAKASDVNPELVLRMLHTKHESWSYEQEVRFFAKLDDPSDADGRSWFTFGPNLELREVIIGSQCDPAVSKAIVAAAVPHGDSVKCLWAGMRRDAFLLVKDDHPPDWHGSVK